MITALEAKQMVFQTKDYYNIVDSKITTSASNGDCKCAVNISEIPNGTKGILYEIASFLNELGYHTTMGNETLNIYWIPLKPLYLYEDVDCEDEE